MNDPEPQPADTRATDPMVASLRSQVRFYTWATAILVIVLVTLMLHQLAAVLEPLAVAAFLCYLIYPPVRVLERWGIHRGAGYAITLTGYGLVAWGLVRLIAMNIERFLEHMPAYQSNLAHYQLWVEGWADDLNIAMSDDPWTMQAIVGNLPSQTLAQVVQGGASTLFGFAGNVLVVAFFMLFILLEVEWFESRMVHAFGERKGTALLKTMQEINGSVERYITLKVLVSVVTAVFAAFTMAFFGLDFFALLALLIFLFNFIPYFGSVVATILPGIVGVLQFENQLDTLWMVGIITVIQQVAGNYWEPRLQGRRLDLSPLLILVFLGVWGWLWGIVGVVLAVPIMVVVRIALDAYPPTRPLAILMGDAGAPAAQARPTDA